MSRRKNATFKIFLSLFAILFILFTAFFLYFVRQTKAQTSLKSLPDPMETNGIVIVVLTGGQGRILEGVKLLERYGEKSLLYISGTGKSTGYETLSLAYSISPDLKARVTTDPKAGSTLDNARESKEFVLSKGKREIILVTANYHMPRASHIFSKIFPRSVAIYEFPVVSEKFDIENWWKSSASIGLMLKEFFKWAWFRAVF